MAKASTYTIEETKSGKYRIRQQINGVRVVITVPSIPSDKQIQKLLLKKLEESKNKRPKQNSLTFSKAMEKYIDSVDGVLSPSTIYGYDKLRKRIDSTFPWFSSMDISEIQQADVQKLISDYAKGKDPTYRQDIKHRSAKTVANMNGFIYSVMGMYRPGERIKVTLPAKQRKDSYVPTDEEIRLVMQEIRKMNDVSGYEVAIALASFGLRRSEICALTPDDLNGNILTINKAKVLDRDRKWQIKDSTKTLNSNRKIMIPDRIADKIREQGFVYRRSPNMITRVLYEIEDKLGIPRFSVHRLRHYFASANIANGMPMTYVEKLGGWSPDSPVLRRVYAHTMAEKEKEMGMMAVKNFEQLLTH